MDENKGTCRCTFVVGEDERILIKSMFFFCCCCCRFGPHFPAMTTAYDRELRRFAKQAAFDLGMDSFVREGVYVHISGPNYETPSESIFLRNIGADAVGMSTAPEVTVARHAEIRVLGKVTFCAHMYVVVNSNCVQQLWDYYVYDEIRHKVCSHLIMRRHSMF